MRIWISSSIEVQIGYLISKENTRFILKPGGRMAFAYQQFPQVGINEPKSASSEVNSPFELTLFFHDYDHGLLI
ncbi:hypothetical protein ASG93_30465 [Paenibacillus sp. Soil787]|nr:hypothetical protein ASG93_30465 [Paenibacillus sp. Soil787]